MRRSDRAVQILLVEDNPGDVRLTREAFRDSQLLIHIEAVGDGDAAIQYLRREHPYEQVTRPDLILLDLNLPKRSGQQVLQEIKQDGILRRIPVLVLTTSQNSADISSAYDLQANCYIRKPMDLPHFWEVVRSIENFWLSTATLPRVEEPV